MSDQAELRRYPIPFSKRRLDRRAVDIVCRLQDAGHETYMVGGCVRDLLLGKSPKDFDLATAATPNQVKRLFRRSRLVGRRFRLVHVYVGREVFEVATFRSAPSAAKGDEAQVLKQDNEFGTPREDALRRDFTVNGMFLDPRSGEILDWAGGMEDLRNGMLHSIGPADRRFKEDPVRILRLIKFMRRLGLNPGEAEITAAREQAEHLAEAAPPRLVEEVFRLLLTGDSEGVFEDLNALGVLHLLMPDLSSWMQRDEGNFKRLCGRLRGLDRWVKEGGDPCYSLRLAVLYGPYVEDEIDPQTRTIDVREIPQVPAYIFARMQERARLPRLALSRASRILTAQTRLDPPADTPGQRKRRFNAQRLMEQDWFPDALEYLRCRLEADHREMTLYDEWHERSLPILNRGR